MEKSRIDATRFLPSDEKILFKVHAKKSKSIYVETAFCLLFWLLTVAGDCFIVGYANQVKTVVNDTAWFLPFFIALIVLHLVPLGMWVVSLSTKSVSNAEKWYILTEKRIISVTEGKPAVTETVELKDVTSVKNAKKYIAVGLEGGRYYKIAGIAETEAFSAALSGALDRIFGDGADAGYAENAENPGNAETAVNAEFLEKNAEADDKTNGNDKQN